MVLVAKKIKTEAEHKWTDEKKKKMVNIKADVSPGVKGKRWYWKWNWKGNTLNAIYLKYGYDVE